MLRIRRILILINIVFVFFWTNSQAQTVAIKTNTVYWLIGGTINGGLEYAINPKLSLDILGAYNPWTFKEDKKMHFWIAQPEVKYWLCEKFEGHFLGLHVHGGQFAGAYKHNRYDDGWFIGGGISYGYDWILSPHWNLEAEIGVGYAHLGYKQSARVPCIKCQKNEHKNYLGPTKAALSIVYIF